MPTPNDFDQQRRAEQALRDHLAQFTEDAPIADFQQMMADVTTAAPAANVTPLRPADGRRSTFLRGGLAAGIAAAVVAVAVVGTLWVQSQNPAPPVNPMSTATPTGAPSPEPSTSDPSAPDPSAPNPPSVTGQATNASSNIANGGSLCVAGDAVYLVKDKGVTVSHPDGSSYYIGHTIWTERRDHSEQKAVSKTHYLTDTIACSGEYLFFSDRFEIYRVSLKTGVEDANPLYNATADARAVGGYVQNLTIAGDRLYFIQLDYRKTADGSNRSTLYSMKLDGSDLRQGFEVNTAYDFTIADGILYYLHYEDGRVSLYRSGLDFSDPIELSLLSEDDMEPPTRLQADGPYLYYRMVADSDSGDWENQIRRINMTGGEEGLVALAPYFTNPIGNMFVFTVNQGVVYYSSGDVNYQAYDTTTGRQLSGGEATKLPSDWSEGLYVLDGTVYIGANTVLNSAENGK